MSGAMKFILRISREAGRQARDNGEPRAANPIAKGTDRRAAWFTGWDERDNELEEAAGVADEATEKARDALPDGAGGGS